MNPEEKPIELSPEQSGVYRDITNTDSLALDRALRSLWPSGGHRSTHTIQGYESGYLPGRRSYGAQLPAGLEAALDAAPSRSDVPSLARAGSLAGAPACRGGYTLTCPSCGHRATLDSFSPSHCEPWGFSRQRAAFASQGVSQAQRQGPCGPDAYPLQEPGQSASLSRQTARASQTISAS